MLQIRYYGDYRNFESVGYLRLRDDLQKYHMGSVVFGMHFTHGGPIRIPPLDAARVANQMQNDSKLPLLVAADVERGAASRLSDVPSFPWPMALGATDDPKEVERFAAITAREARAVGIQWTLAPVADINNNPKNPVINVRSFGEDPAQVGALIAAYIRGAHENGMLVTAKHFPGNGDTNADSHHEIASIDSDLAHLQTIEFLPFKAAIAAGVDSIMLAHARVPALEPDEDKITTISANVVNKTLKGELGFRGLVLTDALEMKGLTKLYDPQKGSPTVRAAVDAVKAGNDVIMLPTDLDGAFHAIVDAVRNGEIPESRIDDSVRKILTMKAEVGLDKSRFVDLDQVAARTSAPEDMEFAQHVADRAITLVRNRRSLLPLRNADSRVVVANASSPAADTKPNLAVIILADALEETNGYELESALRSRRPDAKVFYFDGRYAGPSIPKLLGILKSADQIVIAAYVSHVASGPVTVNGKTMQSFGLVGASGELLKQTLAVAADKTLVIALGSPYLIESYPEIQTYICTYSMAPTSEIAAVKAVFGEIQTTAKLPVTLPGVAERGASLRIPTVPVQTVSRVGDKSVPLLTHPTHP